MPGQEHDDELSRMLCESDEAPLEQRAPSRVKARVYSAIIRKQQETGPLQSLSQTRAAGHGLCIFESLVQIAPVGEKAKSPFYCWTCHARLLAEKLDNPPIFWTHCPYVAFQRK
jgi:hypothetical protein